VLQSGKTTAVLPIRALNHLMYLVPISVPFRRTGERRCEVASDWAKALHLLRDSFNGRFGQITVAAPDVTGESPLLDEQVPVTIDESAEGIRFERLGSAQWRTRDFWPSYRSIRATCDRLAQEADVVHGSINHLWQPYALMGFHAGRRRGKATVFVLDLDDVERIRDMNRGLGPMRRLRDEVYCAALVHAVRDAVGHADLSLLKGRQLHERYGRHARNAKDFFDTSYNLDDVVGPGDLASKSDALVAGGPIRCLALGRLVGYKGLDHSVRSVAAAVASGVDVDLDLIGDGPERPALEALAGTLGISSRVRFLGSRTYGPELIREVARYHLLLFTSLAEETPRSLFDAMAGGCALLAFDVPFTRQVVEEVGHGEVVERGSDDALASRIVALDRDRSRLAGWMGAAARRAPEHAAEVWYRRRAEWTVEAYERHRRGA
jgi:glycosyltransferase involved in cell wall biosynthesis